MYRKSIQDFFPILLRFRPTMIIVSGCLKVVTKKKRKTREIMVGGMNLAKIEKKRCIYLLKKSFFKTYLYFSLLF